MAETHTLNLKKWDVRGSNTGPCIYYAISRL